MFADNIKKLIDNESFKTPRLAEILDMNYAKLNSWMSGMREPKFDALLDFVDRFEAKLNKKINLHWLISGEGEMFLLSKEKLLKEEYNLSDDDSEFISTLLTNKSKRSMAKMFLNALSGDEDAIDVIKTIISSQILIEEFSPKNPNGILNRGLKESFKYKLLEHIEHQIKAGLSQHEIAKEMDISNDRLIDLAEGKKEPLEKEVKRLKSLMESDLN